MAMKRDILKDLAENVHRLLDSVGSSKIIFVEEIKKPNSEGAKISYTYRDNRQKITVTYILEKDNGN